MIVPALVLGHAAIAAALLPTRRLPARSRDRLVVAGAVLGTLLGAALVVLHDSGEGWRTAVLASDRVAIGGAAAAGAWLLVWGLDLGRHRWAAAVFTGVAATSVTVFAANRWSVPAMLFWAAGSLASTGLIMRSVLPRARALAVGALVVSDALLVSALVGRALGDDLWDLPAPVDGWTFWLVVAAALVRGGLVAGLAIWGLLGSAAGPVIPLLAGGGAVLAGGVAGRPAPWLAVALVTLATFSAAAVTLRRVGVAFLFAGPAALCLGMLYVTPDAAAAAGIAVVVGAVTAVLWADCAGRAWVERGLALSFAPTTIGFSAVAVAATTAFYRTDVAESAWDKAPWTAIAALLPVALAAAIGAAARIGRGHSSGTAYPPAVVAMWTALGGSIALGIKASTTGNLGTQFAGDVALFGAAVVAALAVGLAMRLRAVTPAHAGAESPTFEISGPLTPERWVGRVAAASATVAVGIFAGLGVVTLQGLRDGFL